MSSPIRVRLLLALAVVTAAVCMSIGAAAASAACSNNIDPSCFEGSDGDLLTNHGGTDWQDLTGQPALKLKDDDNGDSQFGTGSKEQDPGQWDLNNGSNPGKSNILHSAYSTALVSGDLFLYGAFQRAAGDGNANVSFELNREPGTFDNGTDQVPIRSTGDLLITFDGNNANGVTVRMCMWYGDRRGESSNAPDHNNFGWYTLPGHGNGGHKLKGSGNCTLLSTAANPTAAGAMNNGTATNQFGGNPILSNMSTSIPDNDFGEMTVDVSQALQNSGVVSPCLDFGSIWMHSRSSDTALSNMQDYVGPSNIQASTPCSIDVEKSVAVQKPGAPAPQPQDYQDADTESGAVLADTGDTLNYLVTVTNPGANPITVDTDPPTDAECALTLVSKLDSQGQTDATATLDPGDVWTYQCSKTYDANLPDQYENVATAIGHQGPPHVCAFGDALPCVSDTDPAWVQRAGHVVFVKHRLPGTSTDSFGFTTSADLTAAGLGAFSLSDDGVAGHDRTSVDVWPNHGSNANTAVYSASEGATGPGYRLQRVACDDSDSTGDASARTAIVTVDAGETVTCTFTNRFTTPAVAIDKSGPASATAGDLLPYTLTVTNPGQESLPAGTVVVTDARCVSAPTLQAKNTGAGADATPGSLDPGDSWVYVCSGQTAQGQTSFLNTACVAAADTFGRAVNACDSVNTVLATQVVAGDVTPGEAHLAGRSGCVARSFFATVKGKQIRRVVFSVDGRKRATVSRPDPKNRFKFLVNPRKYKPGSHLLVARSTFFANSKTKAKTMKLRFARCVRRTAPAFTG